MEDDFSGPVSWPKFELVRIASAPDVPPSVPDALAVEGIPRGLVGYEYRALSEAAVIPHDRRILVAFGSCGLRGRLCIDGNSRAVVHVPSVDATAVNAVNVSLDLFARSVRHVIARFPFYSEDCELAEREQVAVEIRSTLSALDQNALAHNGFWEAFFDDLIVGDYATRETMASD